MTADAALKETDVFIDCTASASQFAYWSHRGREEGRRVIRMYVNAYARMLTIVASGKHAAAALVEQEFCAEIAAGGLPFEPDEHSPAAEEVVPGAGCWASTFPARGSDIAALVAAAIPLLKTLIRQPYPSRGEVLVLRRRDADSITLKEPNVIELAWRRAYR